MKFQRLWILIDRVRSINRLYDYIELLDQGYPFKITPSFNFNSEQILKQSIVTFVVTDLCPFFVFILKIKY